MWRTNFFARQSAGAGDFWEGNRMDNNEDGTNLAEVGTELISRQAAIDAVMECYDNDELFEVYEWKLNELPPIQQKGRWIKLDMHRGMADHKCSACEQECYVPTCMGEPMYAYCPNCGAKMEVTT